MSFVLFKLPCTVTRVLDSDDCPPNDGTEYVAGDFPTYYDPLYYPAMHPDLFCSSSRICEWLRVCFQRESLWSDVRVEFREGIFFVEDVSIDLRVCLSPSDIASPRFHPRLLCSRRVSGENGCNLSWVYASEADLADSFDGITVRSMSAVTGKSRAVRTRNDAIQFIVRRFIAFAHRIRVMEECGLEALCVAGGILKIPMLNRRRYMVFELFRQEFGDAMFPKLFRPRNQYRPGTGLCDLSPSCSRLGSVSDSRNRRLENLRLSLLKRWRELTALPSAAVADILNCYDAVVELKSTFSVLTVMEKLSGSVFDALPATPVMKVSLSILNKSQRNGPRWFLWKPSWNAQGITFKVRNGPRRTRVLFVRENLIMGTFCQLIVTVR
ncbi:hypothetical protein EV421DRAFT_2022396 [Armillaria borealis]|uniref:Uncharacterized protein n=1 Tax=Armillaria borealis TaxID=47425 RepID=A0AA39J482_9AGAR|nr:hypothetical protein EV421DRAFT_2022396 [Armillaria borealis]